MDEKESFDDFLARLNTLILKLMDIGEPASDGEMRHVLFQGLPRSYFSLIQTLRINNQIDYETACSHIRDAQEAQNLTSNLNADYVTRDNNMAESAHYAGNDGASRFTRNDKQGVNPARTFNTYRGRGRGRGRGARGVQSRSGGNTNGQHHPTTNYSCRTHSPIRTRGQNAHSIQLTTVDAEEARQHSPLINHNQNGLLQQTTIIHGLH